jgi:hypothetical protein
VPALTKTKHSKTSMELERRMRKQRRERPSHGYQRCTVMPLLLHCSNGIGCQDRVRQHRETSCRYQFCRLPSAQHSRSMHSTYHCIEPTSGSTCPMQRACFEWFLARTLLQHMQCTLQRAHQIHTQPCPTTPTSCKHNDTLGAPQHSDTR